MELGFYSSTFRQGGKKCSSPMGRKRMASRSAFDPNSIECEHPRFGLP